MNTNNRWKKANRLDSILNILLIVLALGVLGLGAVETTIDAARIDAASIATTAHEG